MKRIAMMVVLLLLAGSATEAWSQNWLDQLGKKVKEKVKEKAEDKILETVDRAMDKGFDKAEDAVTGKGKKKGKNSQEESEEIVEEVPATPVQQPVEQPAQTAPQVEQSLEMAYAKSDFVPGDEIMFDDDVTREQLGEFPSQWDLVRGAVEVAQINGDKVILAVSQDDPTIVPLFDQMKSYLPEKFTLEFDFWVGPYERKNDNNPSNRYVLDFYKSDTSNEVQHIDLDTWYYDADDFRTTMSWRFESTSGEDRNGSDDTFLCIKNSWNHFAISFNQRAMKIYINGVRYANIPNTVAPGYFELTFYRGGGYHTNNSSIRNVRIAKGAVPLYDRMMSDGKFITYGITFDVGKATIKPESMGEINRIVQLMNENPSLKFSVEGHTDSTGNATSNQTLSEQRSQAIVAKLVELGIASDRLTAVGKGQNSPIADNSTDEGRAKNRRVEFVKL